MPRRFVRIRHYCFLANPVRLQTLPRVSQWLAPTALTSTSQAPQEPERRDTLLLRLTGNDVTRCPRCGVGHLVAIEELRSLVASGHPPRRARSP